MTLSSARRPTRLMLTALAALGALTLGWATPAPATSGAGIHIPTTTNYCGSEETIVEVTICNETDSGQFYWMTFEDSGAFEGCDEAIVPTHEFLDPNPIFVPRGTCEVVRIRIPRPDELDVLQRVCYWLRFIPSEEGGVTWLGASLIDRPVVCVDWYFEESVHFLHPLVPIEIGPLVHNFGNQPLQMFYVFEARNEFGERDFETLSLNGQAPGEWVYGPLEVPEGESQGLPLQVEWLNEGAGGFYDIVLLDESTFEVVGSIGLHRVVEAPSDIAEGDSADDSPAGPGRLDRADGTITALPNPSPARSAVTFELAEANLVPGADVSAKVFGPDGR